MGAASIGGESMALHPYFDFDVPRNVTARVGQTAFIRCRVEQLGDKSVSFALFRYSLYLLFILPLLWGPYKYRTIEIHHVKFPRN